MLINREDFLKSLEAVMPATSNSSVVVGYDRIAFYKNKVYATNGIISIAHKCVFPKPIECSVKVSDILAIIKRMEDDEVDVAHIKNKLVIKAGKAKASIGTYDIQKNSSLWIQTPTYIELPSDYYDAINCCMVPKNKSNLAGIYVSGNAIMSTDGKYINYATLSKDSATFWINDVSAKALIKAGNIFTEYAVESNEVWLNSEDLTIVIKRLQDTSYQSSAIKWYYDACKDTANTVEIPANTLSVIDRASLFSNTDGQINPITLFISEIGIEITSGSGENSYTELVEFMEVPMIESTTIRVDCGALAQAIKNCNRFKVQNITRNDHSYTMLVLFGHSNVVMLNTLRETE